VAYIRSIFYYVNLLWVRALILIAASRDIQGRENVPRKGPLILVSNHLNNADPPVLTPSTPRQIAWLTKAEWFSTPFVGWLLRLAGMIPVRRFDADLQALRKAQELLRQGGCLGMFPEGTRSKTAGLTRGQPGTALIAIRSGAPIQPAAIWGTENARLPRDIFRRTRVHVRFGQPFRLETPKRISREDIEQGTDRIMRSIAELLPEQYRGVYAASPSPWPRRAEPIESNP
jgi:1-acyl-sn-glycerol-3-phosphate acyltransferase